MPVISLFYGIIIEMFYNEHIPPHFHARLLTLPAEMCWKENCSGVISDW